MLTVEMLTVNMFQGLLQQAAPYMEQCHKMGLSHAWEDLFMYRCLQRTLSLAGVGFSPCTSADFLGFDRRLANGKNQSANAELLLAVSFRSAGCGSTA
jgi:hypothetical protein